VRLAEAMALATQPSLGFEEEGLAGEDTEARSAQVDLADVYNNEVEAELTRAFSLGHHTHVGVSYIKPSNLFARIGLVAGLGFRVHPHQLRHACGFKLANDGRDTRTIQDYLGHRSINSTVRYTSLAASRFNGLWSD